MVSGNQRGIPLLDADWLVLIEDRRDLETNEKELSGKVTMESMKSDRINNYLSIDWKDVILWSAR